MAAAPFPGGGASSGEDVPRLNALQLEGVWEHSNGGRVKVQVEEDAFVIDNPAAGLRRVPQKEFLQHDGLHFCGHTGSWRGSRVNAQEVRFRGVMVPYGHASQSCATQLLQVVALRPPAFVEKLRCQWRKVQNVMFRQTLIRAMQKRGLRGGATNSAADPSRVDLTLLGARDTVDELARRMREGIQLNSWGARAISLEEVSVGLALGDHQVSTDNVDSFSWNPNVEMYI